MMSIECFVSGVLGVVLIVGALIAYVIRFRRKRLDEMRERFEKMSNAQLDRLAQENEQLDRLAQENERLRDQLDRLRMIQPKVSDWNPGPCERDLLLAWVRGSPYSEKTSAEMMDQTEEASRSPVPVVGDYRGAGWTT